jgi:hypothetical protein
MRVNKTSAIGKVAFPLLIDFVGRRCPLGAVHITYLFFATVRYECVNTVMFWGDSGRDFGFDIGFIDHFNTQLVITLNYSAIANFHTLQITRAHAKSSPACSNITSSC